MLIAIAVSCIVFAIFVGLMLMFCKCKRKQTKKSVQAKDYEMDSVRPSIVAQQNQAPPPYYPASGLDNKALEHSMDLALALEDQKSAIYAAQNGYGYGSGLQIPTHNIPAECKLCNAILTFLFVDYTLLVCLVMISLMVFSCCVFAKCFLNCLTRPATTTRLTESGTGKSN